MEIDTVGSKVKNLMRKFKPKNKKTKVQWKKPLMALLIIVILGVSGGLIYENGYSYEVKLNGKDIGFIKNEEILDEALNIVEEDVAFEYGEDAYFNEKTGIEKVRGHNDELVEVDELSKEIVQNIEVLKPASIIVVDGKEQIIVESKEQAEAILEEIKKPYIKDNKDKDVEVLEVTFNQDIEIIDRDVAVDLITSPKDALLALETDQDVNKTHKVSRGDTAWGISRFSNLDMKELEKANPDKDIANLKPGEEINIILPESLLEVVCIERHKSKASIDFETKEKDDSSIFIGEKEVEQEGEKGEKEIVTEFTYTNGIETKKEIIEENIIEEPKNKVVLVGTKERPKPVKKKTTTRTKKKRTKTVSNTPAKYNGDMGSRIVAEAKKYLGIDYVYGGASPAGFDCSGFTSYVYKQCGIGIPRTSGGQGACGTRVSRNQLKPGDILHFSHHVGIYVGGGNFIHSPRTGKRIEITSLSRYGNPLISGRRPY